MSESDNSSDDDLGGPAFTSLRQTRRRKRDDTTTNNKNNTNELNFLDNLLNQTEERICRNTRMNEMIEDDQRELRTTATKIVQSQQRDSIAKDVKTKNCTDNKDAPPTKKDSTSFLSPNEVKDVPLDTSIFNILLTFIILFYFSVCIYFISLGIYIILLLIYSSNSVLSIFKIYILYSSYYLHTWLYFTIL